MYAVRRKIEACKHTNCLVVLASVAVAGRIETSLISRHGHHNTLMDTVGRLHVPNSYPCISLRSVSHARHPCAALLRDINDAVESS